MVVSQKKGTPIQTPIYYGPYYGDPQNGTPNFRKPPYYDYKRLSENNRGLLMFLPKVLRSDMGVSQNWGYLLGGPNNKDYSILGSILGYPYFGKLPYMTTLARAFCRYFCTPKGKLTRRQVSTRTTSV